MSAAKRNPERSTLLSLALIKDEGDAFIIMGQFEHDDDPEAYHDECLLEGTYEDCIQQFNEFAHNGWAKKEGTA